MAKDTYEKLGAFYLGRVHDLAGGRTTDDLLLYDAKDLTTHAVCVGMTGSGKTGLCVTLLEEAAIDGVPAIVIDPKGDIGNMLLTFPKLRPEDFRPWIDESEARRKGMTPDEYAGNRAALWKNGLADWGQDGTRIKRLRDAVDISIYTPGSNAGRPLTVLRSLNAPAPELVDDSEAMRERVASAVSGLLALLGIDADPIRSREHILLANILDRAWRDGRDLSIGDLIAAIQDPGFDRIGVMDLESFFSGKDRFALAMSLNSLLASPGFAAWMEGEPLDIKRLLYGFGGAPSNLASSRSSHLSERRRADVFRHHPAQRSGWPGFAAQPGTSSLRCAPCSTWTRCYGYFPAERPSRLRRTPMLTLLKQARAYGLGDHAGDAKPRRPRLQGTFQHGHLVSGEASNRARQEARVLEGLEGASAASRRHV